MPLINPSNVTLGDIAANPYLSYDPNWVAFDLIVENGDYVLYNAIARYHSDFQFSPPSSGLNVIIPFVNSDTADQCPIAGEFNGTLFPDGNILGLKTSGLTTSFSKNSPFSVIWSYSLTKEFAISKQALHLHSATNTVIGVHPSGAEIGDGTTLNEANFSQGIQLTSGGYWESSDPIKMIIAGGSTRHGCVFQAVSDAPVADISFSLSGYAEIREIIGA
jgi:hypothetical protein